MSFPMNAESDTRMSQTREFDVRVYFEDTDFSGNVYHAAYLKFFERARTEWLRARNIHHSELVKGGQVFAVRHMDIWFDAPAHIDDMVSIETALAELGRVRIVLDQTMRRKGVVLCRARVTVVMLNAAGRPTRLPKALLEAF